MEYNIVIDTIYTKESDLSLFFGKESVIHFPECVDMYDILVKCSIFLSKSDARKNWSRTGKEIPFGFSDFEKIGKLNHRITILNLNKEF